jgi:hypothetical protein
LNEGGGSSAPKKRAKTRRSPNSEHEAPADPEQGGDDAGRDRVVDRPDRLGDRPPLPEQQDQRGAREQHVGAALDRLRHEARPGALEAGPCHHAVLHSEEAEQQQVHDQRRRQRRRRARIDRFRHGEIADEADRIEERRQEDEISDDAIDDGDDASHGELRCARRVLKFFGNVRPVTDAQQAMR